MHAKFPWFMAGHRLVVSESVSIRTGISMSEPLRYHVDSRALQEQFDSTRLADRVAQVHVRAALDEADRTLIGRQRMVFVVAADAQGHPGRSYKGGDPGFDAARPGVRACPATR